LLPDTSYSVQITNLTDNYAAHDPVPVPNEWKFSTGPIQCTYGGSGDGTGSFTDKAKQKACRALKVNFLCSKVFGCSWDGTQCNRSFACVAGKPAANATDVFCARYADDQVGCEKFQSCRYSDGVCSKR